MDTGLQKLLDFIKRDTNMLSDEKKELIISLKNFDKDFAKASNKLRKNEKIHQTTLQILDKNAIQLAQKTRELEIEAALDKVRSRTIAMQHSDELPDVATVMFLQVKSLGISQWTCGFNIWELGDVEFTFYPGSPDGIILAPCKVPLNEHPIFMKFDESRKRGDELLIYEKKGKVQEDHYRYMLSHPGGMGDLLQGMLDAGHAFPTFQIDHLANFSHGSLVFITYEHIPEMHDVFKRFAKVFEQTYTRFLDLQKAEKQGRNAQIEAALERVRSRSLAMHKSTEINEVIFLLNKEMLDSGAGQHSSLIVTDFDLDDPASGSNIWMATKDTRYFRKFQTPMFDHPINSRFIEAYKTGLTFYTDKYSKEEKDSYYKYILKNSDYKNISSSRKKMLLNAPGLSRSVVTLENSVLIAMRYSNEEFNAEQNEIIKSFGFVFEQAYTRFLDLQKAEEQARESKIEVALEKVRSRSMAMHKSEELLNVIKVVSEQLIALNIKFDNVSFGENNQDHDYKFWTSLRNYPEPVRVSVPFLDNDVINSLIEAHKNNVAFLTNTFSLKESKEWTQHLLNHGHLTFLSEAALNYILNNSFTRSSAILQNTQLFVGRYGSKPYTEDENKIIARFAQVFEQSFTRFLDLQKAEEQARESQIEVALERVRSRSLAMHKTDELLEVMTEVFTQFKKLNLDAHACWIDILKKGSRDFNLWIATPEGGYPDSLAIPYIDNPVFNDYNKAKKNKSFLANSYTKPIKDDLYRHFFKQPGFKNASKDRKKLILDALGYEFSVSITDHIGFGMLKYNQIPFSDQENDILIRFTKVFNQSYIRFLDLEKAEAQAREAQIETALERVRSRTIGMQQSEELQDAAMVLFEQIEALGVQTFVSGFNIWEEDKKHATAWMAGKDRLQAPFKTTTAEDVYLPIFEAEQRGETLFILEQDGEELEAHYKYLTTIPEVKAIEEEMSRAGVSFPSFQIIHCAFFSKGYLMFISYEPVPEAHAIFKRFAKVFEQTYTRFLDLQKAEEQAREAVKQSSLDRVRGEIASMRTSADLERITPLIWKELTALGVKFNRCGVFIFEEDTLMVNAYLSAPSGESLATLHLDLDTNSFTRAAFKSWKAQKAYQEVWTQEQFVNFSKSMMELGQIKDPETYQRGKNSKEKLILHLTPFKQGMLYVGSISSLSQEQLELVHSLAEAFAEAYARYDDFNQLEDAKSDVENTLTDLKSAQSQLIQSEKMASLGELTAGIAHEIQNPLNFVTNFSEVSEEMLEELTEEIQNNSEEAIEEIITDIKQNLSKISHHGKRASSIVKGMLDHSRTSSGSKELTDINVLADEYLRLAFHGLRAKDKSFHADFTLDLDQSIPKISIISQDFGRVILNLINNAFYTVNKKGKKVTNGYKPTVSVSTRKIESGIKITIKDNGEGIPEEIVDKIFQPFFTTKPAGEGTGLGLSLAYDIITKGHGGTLTVASVKGDYTEFIIELPVKL